jgi:mRNA-degrading endonuclease toxin of MazEF toxin-antitoxin module
MNFGSTAGREFDGPHYALVISHGEFQRATGLCVVLPTTSKHHPELGALAVKLPPLDGLTKEGWALIHHVRSIDFRERAATLAAQIDLQNPELRQFVDELVDRLFSTVD